MSLGEKGSIYIYIYIYYLELYKRYAYRYTSRLTKQQFEHRRTGARANACSNDLLE